MWRITGLLFFLLLLDADFSTKQMVLRSLIKSKIKKVSNGSALHRFISKWRQIVFQCNPPSIMKSEVKSGLMRMESWFIFNTSSCVGTMEVNGESLLELLLQKYSVVT